MSIIKKVGEGLEQVQELLAKSQGITPDDKAQFNQIIQSYQNFITQNLGQAPGQSLPKEETPSAGVAPMEAGGSSDFKQAL